MFILTIILLIILICICGIRLIDEFKTESPVNLLCMLGLVSFSMTIGVLVMMRLSINYVDNRPEAIDVYRGETSLEVTYVDSVAVDSVVVFKDGRDK